MEFKGTRSWYIEEDFIFDENNNVVVQLFFGTDADNANSKLISKAPEMLEMLKETREILVDTGRLQDAFRIDELIKQATEI